MVVAAAAPPPDLAEKRSEILQRLAKLQRSAMGTSAGVSQHTLMQAFRYPSRGNKNGYYDALYAMVDQGLIASKTVSVVASYALTRRGWEQVGNPPPWLDLAE